LAATEKGKHSKWKESLVWGQGGENLAFFKKEFGEVRKSSKKYSRRRKEISHRTGGLVRERFSRGGRGKKKKRAS